MPDQKLLGWTLEEFAVAAEEYRAKTGKSPLSTLEGACDVQAYWIVAHNERHVKLPEPHPYHEAPVDLGWARALFSKMQAALEKDVAYRG